MVLWFCVCDIQAQAITLQQLKNTSWHLKEPSNPNVDTYFEFSDRVLTNVSDAHYADTKFRKGLKKKYTNKYLYYIANQKNIPYRNSQHIHIYKQPEYSHQPYPMVLNKINSIHSL